MADGNVSVAYDGNDWVVTIHGLRGGRLKYATRREAAEVGQRAARFSKSELSLILDTPSEEAGFAGRLPLPTAA